MEVAVSVGSKGESEYLRYSCLNYMEVVRKVPVVYLIGLAFRESKDKLYCILHRIKNLFKTAL
jgi:hypothetical protein